MKLFSLILLPVFFFVNQRCIAQTTESFYDFDVIQTTLGKNNPAEADKIKKWLTTSINTKSLETQSIFSEQCKNFLNDIPDDITLGNEETPGTLKKDFYDSWSENFDMERIPGPHPFEGDGNGGCGKTAVKSIQYLGEVADEFYFSLTPTCDEVNGNKLIVKVIKQNSDYFIDNVLSYNKANYFN